MLAYAFKVLKQKNYEEIEAEDFENMQDLFAEILFKGISQQLKQGLHREYITRCDNLSTMRGKLDVNGAIKNEIQRKKLLSCEYDELSVNNIYNQILKTTVNLLLRERYVKKERKISLRKIIIFFDEVDEIDHNSIRWDMLIYHQNNKNYEMLMNICYFALTSIIQTTEKGNYKMIDFSDEYMNTVYERFVLEYYKKHHSYMDKIKSAEVAWNISADSDERMIQFLPKMQTDIFLQYNDKVLIIDTKYYAKTLQMQYDKATLHSNNMYQIFTYVKNQDKNNTGNVSGLLLYAKTSESITPDCSFMMGKNRIGVKTLDLNKDFKMIEAQLDVILEKWITNDLELIKDI